MKLTSPTAYLLAAIFLCGLFLLAAVVGLLLNWNQGAQYAPNSGTTTAKEPVIFIGSAVLSKGEIATIPVMVRGLAPSELAGFDLEINFAKDALKVQEVLQGEPPWTGNSVVVSNQRGFVYLSNARALTAQRSLLLAQLRIEAVSEDPRDIDLELGRAVFRSAGQRSIPVSLLGGHITIVQSSATAEVEIPSLEVPPGEATPQDQAPTATPPDQAPEPLLSRVEWLHVEGNRIFSQSGRQVVLRGVNIENREWVWERDQSIDFERRAIPVATGDAPQGWGANVILLAVASGPVNRNDRRYLSNLDELVNLAKTNRAYTLLVYRYGEPNEEQPSMPDQGAEEAMATLAERYADEPGVLYGLQVEPHDVSWEDLKPRFTSMIDAIRVENPRALIAVPGTDWGRYVYWAIDDPISRGNLIYKVHYYDSIRVAESEYRLSEVAGRFPVIVAEFGSGSVMGISDVIGLLDLSEDLGISWAGWLFHEKGCPCMVRETGSFSPTPYGEEIKRWLQGDLSRPDEFSGNTLRNRFTYSPVP